MENNTVKHAACPPPEAAQKAKFKAAEMPMRGGHGPRGPRGRGMGAPKLKNTKGTVIRLLGYLKYVKFEMIGALCALIFSTACTLITPVVSGQMIDLLYHTHGIDPALAALTDAGDIESFQGSWLDTAADRLENK